MVRNRRVRHTLTIDPGLGGTGWCYWTRLGRSNPTPDGHGVLKAAGRGPWQKRATQIVGDFGDLLDRWKIGSACGIVIEFPMVWAGSAKSLSSAERGDLFKLSYLIGGLGSRVALATGREPRLVTPNEWKGQLPKRVVVQRVEKLTGIAFADHEADACGIGMYLIGSL